MKIIPIIFIVVFSLVTLGFFTFKDYKSVRIIPVEENLITRFSHGVRKSRGAMNCIVKSIENEVNDTPVREEWRELSQNLNHNFDQLKICYNGKKCIKSNAEMLKHVSDDLDKFYNKLAEDENLIEKIQENAHECIAKENLLTDIVFSNDVKSTFSHQIPAPQQIECAVNAINATTELYQNWIGWDYFKFKLYDLVNDWKECTRDSNLFQKSRCDTKYGNEAYRLVYKFNSYYIKRLGLNVCKQFANAIRQNCANQSYSQILAGVFVDKDFASIVEEVVKGLQKQINSPTSTED